METLWHTTNVYLHPKLYEYAEKLTAKFPDELQVLFVQISMTANRLLRGCNDFFAYVGMFEVGEYVK